MASANSENGITLRVDRICTFEDIADFNCTLEARRNLGKLVAGIV